MAWLGTWANRLQLTIDNTKVDATLADFPVMVYLSAASGIGDVDVSAVFGELASDANRKKIAITTSDGTTQCYVEIEHWDHASAKAWLHVKVPSISDSADTILYLYYDSAQADNTTYVGDTTDAVTHNVWDSNFLAIYHMAQDPNGDVADAVKDSTIGIQHLTPYGSMLSANLVDGKVGKGIDFDGVGDKVERTSFTHSLGSGDLTFEVCAQPNKLTSGYEGILSFGNYAPALYQRGASSNWSFFLGGDKASGSILSNNQWYYLVSLRESATIKFYQDSVQTPNTYSNIANSIVAINFKIGAGTPTGEWGKGIYDEIRISNTARSAAWIKATYNSLWDSLIAFTFELQDINLSCPAFSASASLSASPQLQIPLTNPVSIASSLHMSGVYIGKYVVCEPLALTPGLSGNIQQQIGLSPLEVVPSLFLSPQLQLPVNPLAAVSSLNVGIFAGRYVGLQPLEIIPDLSLSPQLQVPVNPLEIASGLSLSPQLQVPVSPLTTVSLLDANISIGRFVNLQPLEIIPDLSLSPQLQVPVNPLEIASGLSLSPQLQVPVNPLTAVSSLNAGIPTLVWNVTLSDALDLVDAVYVNERYYEGIAESVMAWENVLSSWGISVESSVSIADTAFYSLVCLVHEYLKSTDTILTTWTGTETITETLMAFVEALQQKRYQDVLESTAGVTDAVALELVIVISEWLHALDSVTSNYTGTMTIQEALAAVDAVITQRQYHNSVESTALVVDVVTAGYLVNAILTTTGIIADTVTGSYIANPSITEALSALDAITNNFRPSCVIQETFAATATVLATPHFNNIVSEEWTIADTLAFAWDKSVSDSLNLVDTVLLKRMVLDELTSALAAADAVSGNVFINQAVAEALAMADTVLFGQILNLIVTDTLNLGDTVTLDGEIWQCWVISTNQFNLSVYSGFEFNSYAVYGDAAFGCKADGIYELTGATDAGAAIHSGIILPETAFQTSKQKKFRKAYFGIVGTTPVLRCETDNGSQDYTISDCRANISRNLKGRNWTLKVGEFDSLEFIEFFSVILSR